VAWIIPIFFKCAAEFPGAKELIESHKLEVGEENLNTTSFHLQKLQKTESANFGELDEANGEYEAAGNVSAP
jgi:hypothetical protein